jgi:hypothetical protein
MVLRRRASLVIERGEVMARINRINNQIADQNMLAGVKGNPQSFPLLVVDGKPVTATDAIAALEARIDSSNHVAPAKIALQEAVKTERDERAKSQALVTGLRHALQAAFADSAEELGKYGLKPRKKPVVSPQTRVAAAVKAKATRAARHTMGSNQKKVVKGDVAGVTVTPVKSPGSPQASAPASSSGATPTPGKLG